MSRPVMRAVRHSADLRPLRRVIPMPALMRLVCMFLRHSWTSEEQLDLQNRRPLRMPVVTLEFCRRCGATRQFICEVE